MSMAWKDGIAPPILNLALVGASGQIYALALNSPPPVRRINRNASIEKAGWASDPDGTFRGIGRSYTTLRMNRSSSDM